VASANLFLSDENAHSLRRAVVEDDGDVAYLYLTEPHLTKIAAAAWIYNRANFAVILPPGSGAESLDAGAFGGPGNPAARDWILYWSRDGHSVAVLADGFPMACIINAANPGYSRGLTTSTSIGNAWDGGIYATIFGRV
jgi:hypothetical protein